MNYKGGLLRGSLTVHVYPVTEISKYHQLSCHHFKLLHQTADRWEYKQTPNWTVDQDQSSYQILAQVCDIFSFRGFKSVNPSHILGLTFFSVRLLYDYSSKLCEYWIEKEIAWHVDSFGHVWSPRLKVGWWTRRKVKDIMRWWSKNLYLFKLACNKLWLVCPANDLSCRHQFCKMSDGVRTYSR